MKKEYTNGEITVVWNADLCIHSGNCVRGLHAVFNTKARPWINMQGADTQAIEQQVKQCPSGALTAYFNGVEKSQNEETPTAIPAVTITTNLNGPLMVEGDVLLKNAAGEDIPVKRKIFLCRCGQSQRKPFCDGSHKQIPFIAD